MKTLLKWSNILTSKNIYVIYLHLKFFNCFLIEKKKANNTDLTNIRTSLASEKKKKKTLAKCTNYNLMIIPFWLCSYISVGWKILLGLCWLVGLYFYGEHQRIIFPWFLLMIFTSHINIPWFVSANRIHFLKLPVRNAVSIYLYKYIQCLFIVL